MDGPGLESAGDRFLQTPRRLHPFRVEDLPRHGNRASEPGEFEMKVYDSILITGGNGMLARALVRSLAARSKSAMLAPRGELDITDGTGVRSHFEKLRPTLLLNCAAYTKVDKAEEE